MTKNSGRKRAARKYQQEHPGTTFPEAMRAVSHPPAEPFSMPHGYILRDQEGLPATFDPVTYTADLNASLLTSDTSDALFLQADGVQLTPEQTEAMELHQAEMVASLVEELKDPWQRSNAAAAEIQATVSDAWQTLKAGETLDPADDGQEHEDKVTATRASIIQSLVGRIASDIDAEERAMLEVEWQRAASKRGYTMNDDENLSENSLFEDIAAIMHVLDARAYEASTPGRKRWEKVARHKGFTTLMVTHTVEED